MWIRFSKKKNKRNNNNNNNNINNNLNKSHKVINNHKQLTIKENGTIIEIEMEADMQHKDDFIGIYERDTNSMIENHLWCWNIDDIEHESINLNNNTGIIRDPNKIYYIKYWRKDETQNANNTITSPTQTPISTKRKSSILSTLSSFNNASNLYKQIYTYKLKCMKKAKKPKKENQITTTKIPTTSSTINQIIIKLSHFEEKNLFKSVDYSSAMFKEYSNWMSINWEKIKNKMVRNLVLPGSHDAASHGIKSNSKRVIGEIPTFIPNSIIYKHAKTQSASIYKQLMTGVRYFDLRVAPLKSKSNELYTFHAMYSVPIVDVLDDIAKFIKTDKRREIIILHWNHLGYLSLQQHHELKSLIKSKLNGLLAPRSLTTDVKVYQLENTPIINIYDDYSLRKVFTATTTSTTTTTAHHYPIQNHHQHHVIDSKKIKKTTSKVKKVHIDTIENEPLFWYCHDSLISSYDKNHFHSAKDVVSFLSKEVTKNHHNKFWVLQCILTIDPKKLLHSFNSSLFQWNNSETHLFLKFIDTLETNKLQTNIIMTDFCTFFPLAQYCIRRNIADNGDMESESSSSTTSTTTTSKPISTIEELNE